MAKSKTEKVKGIMKKKNCRFLDRCGVEATVLIKIKNESECERRCLYHIHFEKQTPFRPCLFIYIIVFILVSLKKETSKNENIHPLLSLI